MYPFSQSLWWCRTHRSVLVSCFQGLSNPLSQLIGADGYTSFVIVWGLLSIIGDGPGAGKIGESLHGSVSQLDLGSDVCNDELIELQVLQT